MKRCLVYPGAGWDLFPVDKFKDTDLDYIYIDPLPDLPHYSERNYGYKFCKTKERLVETLERMTGLKGYFVSENKLVFDLPNKFNNKLIYYINTKDTDVTKEYFDEYDECELYVCGYIADWEYLRKCLPKGDKTFISCYTVFDSEDYELFDELGMEYEEIIDNHDNDTIIFWE